MARGKSSGKSIAVVALLLALGTLALQFYSTFIVQANISTRKSWYISRDDQVDTSPNFPSYITIPNFNVSFDIQPGEAYIVIDGVRPNDYQNKVTMETTSDAGVHQLSPLTIQYSKSELAVGYHTLTIQIRGGNINNYIEYTTLFVQTYIV